MDYFKVYSLIETNRQTDKQRGRGKGSDGEIRVSSLHPTLISLSIQVSCQFFFSLLLCFSSNSEGYRKRKRKKHHKVHKTNKQMENVNYQLFSIVRYWIGRVDRQMDRCIFLIHGIHPTMYVCCRLIIIIIIYHLPLSVFDGKILVFLFFLPKKTLLHISQQTKYIKEQQISAKLTLVFSPK